MGAFDRLRDTGVALIDKGRNQAAQLRRNRERARLVSQLGECCLEHHRELAQRDTEALDLFARIDALDRAETAIDLTEKAANDDAAIVSAPGARSAGPPGA